MARVWKAALGAAAACGLIGTVWAADTGKPDAAMAAAEAVRTEQLDLLKTLVNIDSGTGDVDGGRKVARF